ncbi:FAD-binding oxidoreductase [Oceanimonas pelagia]|uniref:FAD-binding oxidoreductase n=1 Tax=Oceanimonas pelagia TaxID=3028314 RepID=A0AA50Q6W4_9GAMM|nr:FAD-binding oxidoreductase [Oceanimonas pelagia]WMC09850.1 FAD-binding oxidoreductase [Oceanimonas pelagia]
MKIYDIETVPSRKKYDVAIIGGANMGSAVASFLALNKDFSGSVLVIEKDMTFQFASTGASNDCMRQQFANDINILIAQFGAKYVKNFREFMGGDPEVPNLTIRNFGYLYLSDNDDFTEVLKRDQQTQSRLGAGTQMVTPEQIAEAYPFYKLDDIVAGSLNVVDEGYWDAPTMLKWQIRKAKEHGVEYVQNEVIGLDMAENKVVGVRLKSGESITVGKLVNAAGPRARVISNMAGIEVPIEPRRRYTFTFKAKKPLDRDLPLTIDPTGVHFRQEGDNYLVGCPPMIGDPAVDFDDFGFEDGIWEKKLAPILANRIPAFADIEIIDAWVGHYEFNTWDCNAIVGAHSKIKNFYFVNGFSGHGTQQAPSMGLGLSELITYGEYRTLDLSPFSYSRLERGERLIERAVI